MIDTSTRLAKYCKAALKFQVGKAWPVNLSHEMYRKLSQWQTADKYPTLLAFNSKGTYRLARVR